MQKKTKYRILGMLVILGLIVIILPLFDTGSEMTSQTLAINVPPFPDQPVKVDSEPEVTLPDTVASTVVTQPNKVIEPALTKPEVLKVAVSERLPAKVASERLADSNNAIHKIEKTTSLVSAIQKIQPSDKNGLIKIKNSAWVIQIGSFSSKTNALKLVNQLRNSGYRAFIQQVSTAFGQNTRVFVGPMTKQNSARALASQLESDLNIRGIVISYKPLEL